jgi:primosomal protein N' (replication factor Y)
MQEFFVDVLLPLPVHQDYTYRIPSSLSTEISIGKRVIVPFGKNKIYSAVITGIHKKAESSFDIKDIQSVVDEHPVVNDHQIEFWKWMADYYMCTKGEVMNSALPASLKMESETKVMLVEGADERKDLSDNEEIICDALKSRKEMSVAEIEKILGKSSVHSILRRAFEKNVIILSEEIHQRYKPKKEAHLRFADKYRDESAMENLFNELEEDSRKARQVETLMVFMKYLFEDPERYSVKKSKMLSHEGLSRSSVNTLITHDILVEFDITVDRLPPPGEILYKPLQLSTAQETSLNEIRDSFLKHDVTLLHGVTSSGKTEIYIHLIDEMIKSGKQVLYLLPEIALTTQLIVRLQKYFGEVVGVYHSKYSSNERVEVWNRVLDFKKSGSEKSQVVIGARSALFLPFENLGLVIVDEEHDQSFKQSDPAPRYQGRDSAIMLANLHHAKTLLGSATPSLESYFNATTGRYGLVKLTERHGGVQMPELLLADVREAKRKKLMKSHFTPALLSSLAEALNNKEQVILFQNRRGFSNYLECLNCNWIPHCKNCSVTLTYHKHSNLLKCHYCGYVENVPVSCKNCGDFRLDVKGFGTEKIEEEVSLFFPDAKIARMDIDSTKTKSSFLKIISDFEERKIDILVGTQMVTKGLDFDNVSTVGIVNADQLLNFPDFRSFERSYQLIAQVSGRSGRKQKRGKVIIQTQQPDHWVIRDVVKNDYEGFYIKDLNERAKFGYPPHSRLIEITLRHKDNDAVQDAANKLGELLRNSLGTRIHGPHIPLVSKIRNLFYRDILVKIEKSISPSDVKEKIKAAINAFYSDKENSRVMIITDVDPS